MKVARHVLLVPLIVSVILVVPTRVSADTTPAMVVPIAPITHSQIADTLMRLWRSITRNDAARVTLRDESHHSIRPTTKQRVGCTRSHWRRTMSPGMIWIASHETGDGNGSMDPTSRDVNGSSGARELGQLLPSTFQNLHISPSWNPCAEIRHMHVYIHERYGTVRNAVAFWRAHNWY